MDLLLLAALSFGPLFLPLLLSMFLAVNMGGSGTAPAFSAAYGAGLIRRSIIPGLFGVFVLIGALLAGREVSATLGKGLLDPQHFTYVVTSVVMGAIAISLLLANLLGIPQSTSQSTVLAIVGAAAYLGGLNLRKLFFEILPTWFALPIVAFFLVLLIARSIYPLLRRILPRVDFVRLSSHPGLRWLVVGSSLYVAFSIGANNVANASGPISAMVLTELQLPEGQSGFIPVTLLAVLLIAPCFGIGSSLLGHKVTHNTGKEITEVGAIDASVIAFLTASLLLSASLFRGIPTSLVQLNTFAFLALSIHREGWKDTFSKPRVLSFFVVWALAPLLAFALSFGLLALCDHCGVL